MIFIYCIIFLGKMNWLGFYAILFWGIGLLTFIPHFFVIQLLFTNLIKPATSRIRLFFIAGIFISIFISGYFGYSYKQAAAKIRNLNTNDYSELKKSVMTERILGMHFIYHTKFCEYDGWRPPKHAPEAVIGLWFNGGQDPLSGINLEDRINLYKEIYPNKKIKFNCSCAWESKNEYMNDPIWE
jgi:hypothetical protein